MKQVPACNHTVLDDCPMERIVKLSNASALALKALVRGTLITLFNIVTTLVMLSILCMLLAWKLLVVAIACLIWEEKVTVMRGQDTSFTVGPNSTLKTTRVLAWLLVDGSALSRSDVIQMLETNMIYSRKPEISKIYRFGCGIRKSF